MEGKKRDAWIISLLAIIALATFWLTKITGCSTEKRSKTDSPAGETTGGGDATTGGGGGDNGGGSTGGGTGGGGGTGEGGPVKKACSEVVTFDKVKPILGLSCAGCHTGRDTYDQAKSIWDSIVADVQKNASKHMPPGKQLSDEQLALFAKWKADGYLNVGDCDGVQTGGGGNEPPRPAKMAFAAFESTMFGSVSPKNRNDQSHTRWLSYIDRINAGASVEELATVKKAAIKALASVSPVRQFYPPKEIAPGILEINIDDLGIAAAQWALIENGSVLNLESNTTTGRQLKVLTSELPRPAPGTDQPIPQAVKTRLPWLLVSEFNDIVLRSPLYYNLNRLPGTLQQLLQQLGVDFGGDLANGKAALAAFNGSQLSPKANRLVARFEAQVTGGTFHLTEDTGPIVNKAQNVFVNPGIAGGKTVGNMQFAAGEFIFTKDNGVLGFFLADAQGRRLNQADPNVVHDFTANPNSPIIINSISCTRCHAGGYLEARDEVRASLLGPNSQLANVQDAPFLLALYKDAGSPESFAAKLQDDNEQNAVVMKRVGIDVTQPDPISAVSDQFLGDLNLAYIAGVYGYTSVDDFKTNCLNVSGNAKGQIGQISAGGTASHDQLAQVSKLLQQDCRPFDDPIAFQGLK